jgi:hypothetical protein
VFFFGKRRKQKAPTTVRPRLEALEDRSLMSASVLHSNLVSELPGPDGGAVTAGNTAVMATDNQRFVGQLYQDLLNRTVDPMGLAAWSGALNSGMSRSQVVMDIENSQEFRTDEVSGLYMQLLQRAPDQRGLMGFVHFLQGGGTIEQVAANIAASSEYFMRAGGSNDGLVTALYGDLLHRTADAGGRASLDQFLMHGGTRAMAAAGILHSMEFEQNLVQGFYHQFLDRSADAGGLASFTNALSHGATDDMVVAAIAGSNEFLAHM